MPSTYEPIATTTLTSAQSSVSFSSIVGTYTDLILLTSAADDRNAGDEQINIRFNSDTANNYSVTYMYGTGSSVGAGRSSNISFGGIDRTGYNQKGAGTTHILNYSNTTTYKTVLSTGGTSESGGTIVAYVSCWRSTNAITSITLTPNNGSNFDSGSTFTLYGIKAA